MTKLVNSKTSHENYKTRRERKRHCTRLAHAAKAYASSFRSMKKLHAMKEKKHFFDRCSATQDRSARFLTKFRDSTTNNLESENVQRKQSQSAEKCKMPRSNYYCRMQFHGKAKSEKPMCDIES